MYLFIQKHWAGDYKIVIEGKRQRIGCEYGNGEIGLRGWEGDANSELGMWNSEGAEKDAGRLVRWKVGTMEEWKCPFFPLLAVAFNLLLLSSILFPYIPFQIYPVKYACYQPGEHHRGQQTEKIN